MRVLSHVLMHLPWKKCSHLSSTALAPALKSSRHTEHLACMGAFRYSFQQQEEEEEEEKKKETNKKKKKKTPRRTTRREQCKIGRWA